MSWKTPCSLALMVLLLAAACGDESGAAHDDSGAPHGDAAVPDAAEPTDASMPAEDASTLSSDAGDAAGDASQPDALPAPVELPLPSAGPCAFEPPPPAATTVDNAACPDGVYHGDVALRGPADFERLRGCTRLAGSLTLELDARETLEGLESLRVIEGSLRKPAVLCTDGFCAGYNLHLVSLRGLDNLRCVAGDVSLLQPDDKYCKPLELHALRKLVEIGGALDLELCTGTEEHSFESLQRVWGDAELDVKLALERLAAVYGKLETHGTASSFAGDLYVGCREGSTPCRDGVLGCAYMAENQARLAALGKCEIALSDLNVSGTSITSLLPLAKLKEVRGTLTVGRAGSVPSGTEYGRLSTLNGLDKLAKVGHLTLGRLPFVTSLAPLANLAEARALRLDDLDGLQDLTGLEGVTRLTGDQPGDGQLWIGGHAKLATLTGLMIADGVRELRVLDCPLLESLAALAPLHGRLALLMLDGLPGLNSLNGLERIEAIGLLDIEHCNGLLDLSELSLSSARLIVLAEMPSLSTLQDFLLPAVTELEELQLSGLPSLQSLAGLEGVQKLQALHMLRCDGLKDLTGLDELREVTETLVLQGGTSVDSLDGAPKLQNIGMLQLEAIPELSSLAGLTALKTAGLRVIELPELASLAALSGVQLGSLELQGLPVLSDLSGLEAVTSVDTLSLEANPQLADISALSHLTTVEGTLTLAENPALQNLHGLEGLRELTASVTHNETLEEVRALGGLTEGHVTISGNAALPQCELDWLTAQVEAVIEAHDNGPLGSCPP
ncbi:MAG TPA: hypothetical protein VJV78_35255 [Polyangiales bacterium]|nr:hypothetical protein [Polyangiales bacterium]